MKPFRQGVLDYTCGLYSVVNAIKLAAKSHKGLNRYTYEELYHHLVYELDRARNLSDAIQYGMNSPQISMLLRAAKEWLLEHEKIDLRWGKPYHTSKKLYLPSILTRMREHLEEGGSVLVSIEFLSGHWTVIRKITPSTLMMFDSAGYHRFKRSDFCLWSISPSSFYHFHARNAFFISCRKNN